MREFQVKALVNNNHFIIHTNANIFMIIHVVSSLSMQKTASVDTSMLIMPSKLGACTMAGAQPICT